MQTIHVPDLYLSALVAKKRIHGRRGTNRDSYNAAIAENVSVNTILAYASHRDAMAVAATIANQSEIDRRDAADQARGRQAVSLLKPTMPKREEKRK